jgi:hypothetical protein
MTAAQNAKYWWEWARAREHFLGRGLSHAAADAKRHDLHRKALGHDKSSKSFTNADLDAVLAAFRAVWDGGNLDAQLRQIEQPELRKSRVITRLDVLSRHLQLPPGREHGYLRGIARNVFGNDQYQQLGFEELCRLEGIVLRRLKQLHEAAAVAQFQAEAAAEAEGVVQIFAPLKVAETVDDGDPF